MEKVTSIVKHKKHAHLTKPQLGLYGRKEISFTGASCSLIQNLVRNICTEFGASVTCGFVDADHAKSEDLPDQSLTVLTDKISHHRIDYGHSINEYDQRQLMSHLDFVFVNGNHFKASAQVVILNSKKEESLSRKLDRLDNVKLIITDDVSVPFEYLKSHIEEIEKIPVIHISEIQKIAKYIQQSLQTQTPAVNSLVLAGGESRRMGQDKTQIKYHSTGQSQHMYDLLIPISQDVFISCQKGQAEKFPFTQKLIFDTFTGLGPFGAILSAFRTDPNSAWLVVASDQPMLTSNIVEQLIAERDRSKIATCFYNDETGFPEPLITLWEPKSYQKLLYFLSLGYSCPRKVLINSDVKVIKKKDITFMKNANTPKEFEQLSQLVKNGQ